MSETLYCACGYPGTMNDDGSFTLETGRTLTSGEVAEHEPFTPYNPMDGLAALGRAVDGFKAALEEALRGNREATERLAAKIAAIQSENEGEKK